MEEKIATSIFDDFTINDDSKTNLNGIAQWVNISAIVGFVSIGVSVLSTLISIFKFSRLNSYAAVGTGMISLLITIGISLLLNITLLQAATNLKRGLVANDQGFFDQGITKLATYFRIIGILTIIGLIIAFLLVLLLIVIALVFKTK